MEKMRDLIESNLLLLHLSITDHLTGICNRTYLNEKIVKEMESAEQENQPITAMMLDINNFKYINDTCGHLAGDRILKKFAAIITNSLRNQDLAFRFGGDEFYILMPNTAIDSAFAVADRLHANIENVRIESNIPLTASIGIAERLSDESLDDWFIRLDQALYNYKNKSGNQVARE